MLILSRKVNESIVIDGRIVVKVLRIDKDTVKLGIQAPLDLAVHREEIYNVIQKNKQASMNACQAASNEEISTFMNGGKIPPGYEEVANKHLSQEEVKRILDSASQGLPPGF